jgi:hypothetical protein
MDIKHGASLCCEAGRVHINKRGGGIKVISLEKAKALKEAGLLWEPCFGEWVHVDGENKMVVHVCEGDFGDYKDIRCLSPFTGIAKGLRDLECIWLPSLSQELAEIGKRGWDVERLQIKGGKTFILLHRTRGDHIPADWSPYFSDATPEDATADALLYLLKQEDGGNENA